jgi:hypothetical protein
MHRGPLVHGFAGKSPRVASRQLDTFGCGDPRAAGGIARARAPRQVAARRAFLQAFPKLGCFSPSFSKESFGRFVGFQWVASLPNPKCPHPNILPSPRARRTGRAVRQVGIVEGTSKHGSIDCVFPKEKSSPMKVLRAQAEPRGWPGIGRPEERPSFDGLCPAMTEMTWKSATNFGFAEWNRFDRLRGLWRYLALRP